MMTDSEKETLIRKNSELIKMALLMTGIVGTATLVIAVFMVNMP